MITHLNETYNVVVVIPAGRKRYLELLIPQLLKQEPVDEIRLWLNVKELRDKSYVKNLSKLDKKITVHDLGIIKPSSETIYRFYRNTVDKNTIYVRLDDDIVWLDKDFITELVKTRIEYKEHFVVFGNIINNVRCDYIHQEASVWTLPYKVRDEATCLLGWFRYDSAAPKHNIFLEMLSNNEQDKFKHFNIKDVGDSHFSVNAFAFFGKDFAEFDGMISVDEEKDISIYKPKQLNKTNIVCGKALCVHYAFIPQRTHITNMNILERYKDATSDNNSNN